MKSPLLTLGLIGTVFFAMPLPSRGELRHLPRALLDRPVPESDWQKVLDARIQAGEPLPELPPPFSPPADDAPPSKHLAHWRKDWSWRDKTAAPTAAAREKILQAIPAEPAAIPEVLRALPATEAAAKQIDALLPKLAASTPEDLEKLRAVRAWIYRHSGLHRDEVIADARQADWELYRWNERPDPTLDAIQARAPELSAKLLEELATTAGTNPGLAVVAARLLAVHSAPSARARWQQHLIAAAANPLLHEKARSIAVDTLLEQDWPGREAWILSCIQQPDPGDIHDFSHAVHDKPDHWIPLLTAMVGGENRDAHNHAVYLLAALLRPGFSFEEVDEAWARVQLAAARPLLPWLKDPDWAVSTSYSNRGNLIDILGEIDLPESVPGLLQLIREDEDTGSVASAAESIVRYRPPDAVPALKDALKRSDYPTHRARIIAATHKLGGFSKQECVAAVEALFEAYPDAGTLRYSRDGVADDPAVDIGDYLVSEELPKDPALVEALAERANALEKENPKLANTIRNQLVRSSSASAPAVVAGLLASGGIEEEALFAALRKRREPGWDGSAFRPLLDRDGLTRGFAAILSADPAAIASAFASEEKETRLAMLATATLTGDLLDIERVSALLPKEEEGEADEDDAEAKEDEVEELIRAAADGYVRLGEHPEIVKFRALKMSEWDPAKGNYGEFSGTIAMLAARLGIKERLMEIFSLSGHAPGGGWGESYELIVYPDRTIAVQNPVDGSLFLCELPAEQLGQVRSFIQTYRSDDLPRLELPVQDGVHYRYVHACNTGMRTVFMNNPPTSREEILDWINMHKVNKGIVHYARLVGLFQDLFDKLPMRVTYEPGIEVLIPRDKAKIRSVWKQGDDLRVLVENSTESAHWQGVSLANMDLSGPVAEPADSSFQQTSSGLHPDFNAWSSGPHARYPWQVRSGDANVLAGRFRDVRGLWLCRPGKEPELLADGGFSGELVSADGKWCVVAKMLGESWAEPNLVVRINLETKKELPVDLKRADSISPIAFLPAQRRFLIRRASDSMPLDGERSEGPGEPEFHLLDAATGALKQVTGDFQILSESGYRPMQRAESPGKLWAVDSTGRDTRIGKFDTKTLRFEAVKEIQGISFQSDSMWVDEKEGLIYAAVNGDLVRVPLR